MNPNNMRKLEVSDDINWPVVTIIMLGTFMAILDSSIVNVALPKMMAVFGAPTDQIEWILTAYMLTLGVVMPLSGYLGDTFGYKRCYFVALSLFVLGSALCGLAWSVNSMIAARVIQALGGGILQPLGMAVIYKICPREKIGMVLGVWGISTMAAPAVGPTLGGYLVEYVNWRMIFYINLPVGIINLFLVLTFLHETALIKGKRLDLNGIIFSTLGFFCLLLALSKGAGEGWTSPYIVSLLLVAIVSLTIFVVNELRQPEPILDLRLFKNFIFTISNIIGSILSIGLFGAIFLMPILIQNVLGQTAMKSGLIMLPAALVSGLVMPISGKLFDRYGARWIVMVGLALITLTTYMMGTFNDLTPFAVMTMWLSIRSIGMGFTLMPAMTAGMNTVPPQLVGRASAVSNVIRQIFASFGIAMFTTIMQNRQVFHFANLAQSVNMSSNAGLAMQGMMQGLALRLGVGASTAQTLGVSLIAKRIGELSMIQAIDDCYVVAAAMCFFGLLLAPLLRDRKKAAVQHREPSGRSHSKPLVVKG